MGSEDTMPDFEWSPEAIEAASRALYHELTTKLWSSAEVAAAALDAAVKAQPVVALPPCPTCKGTRLKLQWSTTRADRDEPCPACKGSGVERMVPVSKIVALLDSLQTSDVQPSWCARVIEHEFGGPNAF